MTIKKKRIYSYEVRLFDTEMRGCLIRAHSAAEAIKIRRARAPKKYRWPRKEYVAKRVV